MVEASFLSSRKIHLLLQEGVMTMSMMKRYLEDHIDEFSDDELLDMGYSKEDIKDFRRLFSSKPKRRDA